MKNQSVLLRLLALAAAFILPAILTQADDIKTAEPKSPKSTLAPHTVVIQASLQSAMDQLKGIRNQLEISAQPSPEVIDALKVQTREINADIRQAMSHEMQLQSGAKKYPDIAAKSELKAVNKAMDELETLNQGWQSKAIRTDYWRNKELVRADLDRFEKQLIGALDKTRSFSSEQLGFSPSIG